MSVYRSTQFPSPLPMLRADAKPVYYSAPFSPALSMPRADDACARYCTQLSPILPMLRVEHLQFHYVAQFPPALPMLRVDDTSYYKNYVPPAPSYFRSDVAPICYHSLRYGKHDTPTLIHRSTKFSRLASLRSMFIKCDNGKDTLRCSRLFYSQKIGSVLHKLVPKLARYVIHCGHKFYDYFLFVSFIFFEICTNVAGWAVNFKMSFIHSPSWKVHYISLQLSRNLYRRHDF